MANKAMETALRKVLFFMLSPWLGLPRISPVPPSLAASIMQTRSILLAEPVTTAVVSLNMQCLRLAAGTPDADLW